MSRATGNQPLGRHSISMSISGTKAVAVSAAITLSLLIGTNGIAQAAPTETVTNLNDSGAGSLRQALADVDAGGTVTFDSSLSGTIDLQTALEADKSFTLTGPGARQVTIDANNRDNILVIGSNTPGDYLVEVEGLTFFRGAARNPDAVSPTTWRGGGGIAFVSGNALTVRDSVFRQNLSSGGDLDPDPPIRAGGGGIEVEGCTGSNDGATLTIESSLFVRNGAFPEGGAVAMRSKRALTITDTEFRNNVGEGGQGGGAVLVHPRYTNADPACVDYKDADLPSTDPVTITDSLFTGNGGQADNDGPAISFQYGVGPKTIQRTEFRNNGGDGRSGALFDNSASPMFVEDSLFRSNAIENDGGAIWSDADYPGPQFTDMFLLSVADSAFIGNSAEDDGGAIMYEPARDNGLESPVTEMELRITNSEFIGNFAGSEAGGIFHDSSGEATKPILHVSDSLFEENYSYASSGGSAIDWDAANDDAVMGEIEILDTVVDSNVGGEDGIPVELAGALSTTVMNNVSVTNNVVADTDVAAINLNNNYVTDTDCTDPGMQRSQYDLSNVTVAGNSTAQSDYGAVHLLNCGSLDMDNSTIALNVAVGSGFAPEAAEGNAGLRITNASVANVRNSIIAMNSYSSNLAPDTQNDCWLSDDSELTFEGGESDNLVGSLTGCEAATGTPLTGNPGFAEFDPVEVQNIETGNDTVIVPLAADSPARGAGGGVVPATDQRGAARPETGSDLGAVQFYEEIGLRVFKTGNGDGTVTSRQGEIVCGATCDDFYPQGTTVTLTADPDAGSAFTGWSGGCTGTALTCEVTVEEAETVTANFSLGGGGGNANVRIRKAKRGTITVGPNRTFALARITCPRGTCSIQGVDRASVRVRGRSYRAKAIFPTGSFAAGQTRLLKVRIPQAAYGRLARRKSGIVSVFSVSVANDSGGDPRVKVFRSLKSGLRKR